MILDLMRHASTGRQGHLDGRTDPPLLDGAMDALLRCHGDGQWSRVIASPRRRALDTATALVAGRDLFCEIHPDWAELDFGDWDGCHYDEIPAELLAGLYDAPHAVVPPNGESWRQFEARIDAQLRRLLDEDEDEDAGLVLVVSHAGVLRLAVSRVCGMPLAALWAMRIDYGTRVRLRVERGGDGQLWGELLELCQP
ncbi:MAG: histidine phosphatase family protein [Stenotrophomonas nitritireducens]|uniref:histidine phosphatase family protein n=1 Tax=Stenotrophomonas nitritireducens TaxID=83617 RepID=UPI001ACA016F|nr:histidine phosphatase family protein [Stenotrophomonas nitritireducens]MBN8793607.1 histidine phosphatase family protein [Stenotrophomonas nitritireducens]MBN8797178.1 histidine phosphatase family protein [Stenotrophomonas nitritireducens]